MVPNKRNDQAGREISIPINMVNILNNRVLWKGEVL
jgi:hypothetical protein